MSGRTSANDQLSALVAARQFGTGPATLDGSDAGTIPCLLMRMGDRWCSLRAESVREVIAMGSITPVPGQQAHVLGVMLVHGRLVPVVDLCRLVPELKMTLTTVPGRRLVVVSMHEAEVGIAADDAKGVIHLSLPDSIAQGALVLGDMQWNQRLVPFLDEDLLLASAFDKRSS